MLKYIVPLWFAMIINTLLGITDMFFLNQIDRTYIAIVGVASIPLLLISTAFIGFGIEANRSIASNKIFSFKKTVLIILSLSAMIYFISIIGEKYILFYANKAIYSQICDYYRINMFLLVPTSIIYLCTGIMRGSGKPKKTVIFSAIAVLLNFAFDYLFIKHNFLNSPLKACAIASVFSDLIVAFIYYIYIVTNNSEIFNSHIRVKASIKSFFRNSSIFSLEKLFSVTSLTILSSLYIAKIDVILASVYYGIEKLFSPITMIVFCYFEWVIYSKSKKIDILDNIIICHFITIFFPSCCVVVSQQCHRIASFLRLA